MVPMVHEKMQKSISYNRSPFYIEPYKITKMPWIFLFFYVRRTTLSQTSNELITQTSKHSGVPLQNQKY